MNLMKWLMFLLLSISCACQEFTLFVKTQSQLKPINLQFVQASTASKDFFNQVKSTLEFDLSNCGYCENKSMVDSTIIQLKLIINNNYLEVIHTQYEKSRNWNFELFSGEHENFIHQLHKIADELVFQLFGEYGISSDRIVYARRDPHLFNSEILCKYFDSFSPEQLTFDGNFKLNPIFIPNGDLPSTELLFVSYALGPSKIFIQNLKEKNAHQLINLRGNQFLPSLSNNGEFLSFISDASGSVDLFVIGLNKQLKPSTKPMQIFSYNNSVQASSSFDPMSSKIAFVSDYKKKPKVYEIDLLKTLKTKKNPDLELLTPYEVEATCPAYSPDGKKLAYCTPVDGVRQIFIYDIENQIHYALTEGPHDKENPSWAANNLHLVYNTTNTDNELYVININQKNPIKITEGYGYKYYPCWERIKKRKIKDPI